MEIFDLYFGEYPLITYSDTYHKVPTLVALFPLYMYTDEYVRISSFGPEKMILTPFKDPNLDVFDVQPTSLLNNQYLTGWESSVYTIPSDLPFYSKMFVIQFDALARIKYKTDSNGSITFSTMIFAYKSVNLSTNFEVSLYVGLTGNLDPNNIFTGTLKISMFKDSHYYEVFNLMIVTDAADYLSDKIFNNTSASSFFNTSRLRFLDIYQLLSTQTIILRVFLCKEFCNQKGQSKQIYISTQNDHISGIKKTYI